MNKKATFFSLIFALPFVLFSQTFVMDGSPITACNGFFTDSGGNNGSYSANENLTTTICSDGTAGTHIQLVFNGTELGAGDDICFFDGMDTGAPMLTCASEFGGAGTFIIQATAVNPGGCVTVVFTSDGADEMAGWSADINCIAACQTIEAILTSTDPLVEPVDTGWIDVCPSERVFFNGAGGYPQDGEVYNHSDFTSTFEWDFGDGTFGFGPSVSHVYDEAGGYVVQLKITDQFDCTNSNFISQRIRVSTRPSFAIGGNIDPEICALDTVRLNAMVNDLDSVNVVSVTPNEANFLVSGIRSDSLALPDGDGASYQTSISFSDFSPGQVLTDINDLLSICVVMEHSWMRDLEIMLTCPNGETVILHDHPGQTGGEVFLGEPFEADEGGNPIPGLGYEYCWTPNPPNPTWIQYSNANNPGTLPPGDYSSFQPLTNFLGCPLNGEWTITVTDLWGIDNGFIFSWGINFNEDLYPNVETFTPNLIDWTWNDDPSIFFQTMDSIAAAPQNAGTANYTFTVFDDFGCAWDTSINFQVLPFTHPDCYTCTDILNPAPDTVVCIGEEVNYNVFAPVPTDIPVTYESYPAYDFSPANHPASNPYEANIDVIAMNPETIGNPTVDIISVCVDIETDFDADISIWLRSPDGTMMELSTNNGGSGDNYTQTCFTPTAAIPINAGSAPFTGNFQPEGSWNDLVGSPINGTWSLMVADAFGPNVFSRLNQWNITFNSMNEVDYFWSNGGSLSCITCPDPTASPTTTTTYNINAIDSHDCVSTDEATIVVLDSFEGPAIDWDISSGGIMNINWTDVAPGNVYEININGMGWEDPNNGLTAHQLTGLVNGDQVDIDVRVKTFGATCDVEIGEEFGVYLLCSINAFTQTPSPFLVSCPGDCDAFVQVSADSAVAPVFYTATFLDDGTTFTQNNGAFFGLCAGNYKVVTEDGVGCTDSVFFEVLEPEPIVGNITETISISCFGEDDGQLTASAMGGTGMLSYQWDDQFAQIGPMANSLNANTYSVQITDENGCMGSASFILDEPTELSLSTASTDVLCNGENTGTAEVTAMGGVGGYQYNWNAGATPTNNSTGGLLAGLVSVEVMDANGCLMATTVMINEPAEPVSAMVSQTLESCFQQNSGEATAVGDGGVGNYTYNWSSGSQTNVANDLAPQNYSVTITDGNDCSIVENITITELPELTFNLNFTEPSCPGSNDGAIGPQSISGGVNNGQPLTFNWSNGPSSEFNPNLLGGINYVLTITDSQGCSGSEALFLPDPPAMTFSLAAEDVLCFGGNSGSATISNIQNPEPGGVDILWGQNTGNQTTETATELMAGDYTVMITNDNGCTVSDVVSVGEPTEINIDFDVLDNRCFGLSEGVIDAVPSGGTPGYSLLWKDFNTTEAKLGGLGAGTFTLSVTDANGCVYVDSTIVNQPESINALIEPTDVSCFGDRDGMLNITPQGGTPPFSYSIDGENFFGSSTLIGLEQGEYFVTIKDGNDCQETIFGEIGSPDEMTVDILQDLVAVDQITVDFGDTTQLNILQLGNQGAIDIFWSASFCGTMMCGDTLTDCDETIICSQPFVFPNDPITYFVNIVDEQGCEANASLVVFVDKEKNVIVPTGFTPQVGGMNNALHVHGKEGTKIQMFRVFDRWGELLYEVEDFEVNDLTVGWDGTFKGKEMPTGVYVWHLVAEYPDGMTETYVGESTLVR